MGAEVPALWGMSWVERGVHFRILEFYRRTDGAMWITYGIEVVASANWLGQFIDDEW
jgi:hypothetical protein